MRRLLMVGALAGFLVLGGAATFAQTPTTPPTTTIDPLATAPPVATAAPPISTPAPVATADPNAALPNNGGPIENLTIVALLCLLTGVLLIGWQHNHPVRSVTAPSAGAKTLPQMAVFQAVVDRYTR